MEKLLAIGEQNKKPQGLTTQILHFRVWNLSDGFCVPTRLAYWVLPNQISVVLKHCLIQSEAITQNEKSICCLINLISFLRLKFQSLLSGGSYIFIKAALSSSCSVTPCCSMLFHIVPCLWILLFILIFICVINALLPGNFIAKALQNLHSGYFKHIWVVAVMEAS